MNHLFLVECVGVLLDPEEYGQGGVVLNIGSTSRFPNQKCFIFYKEISKAGYKGD